MKRKEFIGKLAYYNRLMNVLEWGFNYEYYETN